jgi:drug/metabolite transporter (DMT)-like permease
VNDTPRRSRFGPNVLPYGMHPPGSSALRGPLLGLAAAAAFGLSTPFAKLLLSSFTPTLLAGLLYLGAALALWGIRLARRSSFETPLRRADVPLLAAVVLTGGVVGPVLMLLGLRRLSAFSGSLLLNLEAPFTMLLAVLVFREHLGRRTALAGLCIVGGAAVLKLEPGSLGADAWGMLLIAAACLCWAIDNNLTQRLSLRDPFAIVRVKATGAALANTTLALTWLDASLPSGRLVAAALALGSVSYGASIVLDAYALRLVGASREAAYFATAPFLGASLSVALFDTPLRLLDVGAMLIMLVGVVLMLREKHGHAHVHEPLHHEHVHTHDEHHGHVHLPGDPQGEPHAHRHHHGRLQHDHPHVPDLHHRHEHH